MEDSELCVDQMISGSSSLNGPKSKMIPPLFILEGPDNFSAKSQGFIGLEYVMFPLILLPVE
jgi:hypothetical protein